ncbi:MAG TPA: TonB-dependent receptor [Bryobacteraceae bacterium]|nr:TonB-dependent receptor [Bryobacteraceae bacterium]
MRSLIALLALGIAARAQVSTGTMTGIVSDVSGGLIPKAAIRVVNIDTGVVRELTTDSAGLYTASGLLPGNYEVAASFPALQTRVETGLILSIGKTLTVNFNLPPARRSQTVSVEAGAQVDITTSSMSDVIDKQLVAQLPLNGRDFTNLIGLAAGAQPAPEPLLGNGEDAFDINGGRQDGNSFLIDGIDIVPPGPGGIDLEPNLEAIAEFQVLTSNFSAEYGRSLGGIINVHIKSGENAFHGSLFEFFRNDALDAIPLFALDKSPYRFNQFGGSMGGPILKNKFFFFGDYQGERIRSDTTVRTVVPLPQEAKPVNGYYEFPNNPIPASIADPTTALMLSLLPAPNCINNVGLCGAGNFIAQQASPKNQNSGDDRFDYNATDNDRISFLTLAVNSSTFSPSIFGPRLGSNLISTSNVERDRIYSLNYTHVFNASSVNEFLYAYTLDRSDSPPTEGMQYEPSIAGLGYLNLSPSDPFTTGFPAIENLDTGTFFGSGLGGPSRDHFNTPQLADNFSWIAGRHSFKTGVAARFREDNSLSSFAPRGGYLFADGFPTDDAFANIVLGIPVMAERSLVPLESGNRVHEYAAYLQDYFKKSPRLTLNLGVRWDLFEPAYEAHNRLANFDPTTLMMIFPCNGNSRSTLDTDYLNFAPRVGFAYQLTSDAKTSIRGGYGISYLPLQFQGIGTPTEVNTPFAFSYQVQASANPPIIPPGVSTGIPVVFPANPASIPSQANITYYPKYQPTPYAQQWNLDLQRALPGNLLADIAYVGSAGIHLSGDININQWPPNTSVDASPVSPNIGIIQAILNEEQSNYHSLQVKLNRRFANAFALQASYNWSRSIDDSSALIQENLNSTFPQNSFNLHAERGPSDFNATHRFVAGFLYVLPFGTQVLNHGFRALNAVTRGWQLNGIVTAQSGQPFTPLFADGDSAIGAGPSGPESNVRANIVGDPNRPGQVPADPGCPAPAQIRTAAAWFNPCAFVAPVDSFGNAGRNSLAGPKFVNTDLSLFRAIHLTERWTVEARGEVFNALNHPNLGFPNNMLGSSSGGQNFGQVLTIVGNPRQIQFALKLLF